MVRRDACESCPSAARPVARRRGFCATGTLRIDRPLGQVLHDPDISVILENEYMRVLSVRIAAGQKEPWHTHTWPAVVVYFSLPPSQRFEADGRKTPRAELKQLEVRYDATAQPSHSVENLGKVMYQAYRVELKPTTKVAATKSVH